MKVSQSLAGRTALVTGSSSGIGAHLAELFGKAGARVVLAARRADRLSVLATRLGSLGIDAIAVEMDVTNEASVIAAYDQAEGAFGTVDTIVANAGVAAVGRSTKLDADKIESVINTNLTGVYLTVREGAKRLMTRGSAERENGRVIIIGSITSHFAAHTDTAYAATKAGVAHLARSMAREWIRQGINVNTISPGYIDTDISGDWYQSEGGKAHIASMNRRRLLEVTALDDVALLFASDASRQITGAEIIIDDGQLL
ncbi:MAG: SDR family oxidoreductase [Sphingorhabdus sp.]